MSTSSTVLGPYYQYEIPPDLTHTYYQSDGSTPRDLTGFSVQVHWWVTGQSPPDSVSTFNGSLSDAANGVVAVSWAGVPEVFEESGHHQFQIFAGNGTYRYSSEVFSFQVVTGVAATEPGV